MRISDWSSDVCSSDVFMSTRNCDSPCRRLSLVEGEVRNRPIIQFALWAPEVQNLRPLISQPPSAFVALVEAANTSEPEFGTERSEEHKSELQSLKRSSYAHFCLKKNICT